MLKDLKIYLFIISVCGVTLIPAMSALDKAATQWLYLSTVMLVFTVTTNFEIKKYLQTYFTKAYSWFVILALVSLSYTNNLSVSLVDLSRHLSIFILGVIAFSLIKEKSINLYKISIIVSAFLLYECIISLRPLISYIYSVGLDFSTITSVDIDHFKGVTGNRNITTAAMVCKIPFALYLIYQNNKRIIAIFGAVCIFSSSLVMFIITSRAALLSLSLYILMLVAYAIIRMNTEKHKKTIISSVLFLMILALSFTFSRIILPTSSSDAAARLSSIELSNQSSSNRFILWENAYDYISKNPLIGCGIGNWKIESSAYWSNIGASYLVPFHAHNDFLEFTTELGIIGGLAYLMIFIFLFLALFKLIIKNKSEESFYLCLALTGLFVDSFFNFPFERPIMQVLFVIIISFGAKLFNQNQLRDEI